MIAHSYLHSAKKIINTYDGLMPLASWLKLFFKSDKKFGSTDRKQISHACYCYYRLGNAFQNVNMEERMFIALFLCSVTSNKILEELKPELNKKIHLSIEEKLKSLNACEEVNLIFPFNAELSEGIDINKFNRSFLIQPDLFLRLRPGAEEKIISQLDEAGINFLKVNNNCIQLSNQTKVNEVIQIDKDAVVQDYNSQKIGEVFENLKSEIVNLKSAWDCCAASGGKSILFHDFFPATELTVSDIRKTILINLQKRFAKAGIKKYRSFVADLTKSPFSILHSPFDVVICDAPCSGSGTWSRTPEQLHFFKKEKISDYADLQKKIVLNAAGFVKENGFFFYITCSVFEKENEEVVNFIQNNLQLQLKSMQYLKGYDKKADTLFVAVFSTL